MKNDARVLKLKKQIEEKKIALQKSETFKPVTNCSIEINMTGRVNLHTANKETLINMLVFIHALRTSADDLGLYESFKICGHTPHDWETDIKARMAILKRQEEEAKLKSMEIRLDSLLSSDKKTELELDNIENFLK